MFVDWINRQPPSYLNSTAPKQSPLTWTPEQRRTAATLEESFRSFGDVADPELKAIVASAPAEIREYVGETADSCRGDDGIFRRFPDQLLRIILSGRGDAEIDAAGAMEDAVELVRNIRQAGHFGRQSAGE